MSGLSHTLLLVTEEVHHARLIQKALDMEGRYQVVLADSLALAATRFRESHPDLILASPRLTDGEAADLLAMMDRHRPVPILVLAEPDEVALARTALDQGCLDYVILDGATLSDMGHVISRALRLWRLEKEQPTREMALLEMLKAKEALLKEMYHRVKNNFQTVCSVLSLQSQHLEDETVLNMFTESQDRVRAMALIHERLYRSDDLTHVNFPEYVDQLVQGLFWSYSVDRKRIQVDVNIHELQLDMITAIPCGLIINELVSNALKYAFPPQRKEKGHLTVFFQRIEEGYVLRVTDDGVGFPADLDFRQTTSLGLQLVIIFAEDQLNGQVALDRRTGTTFEIAFNRRTSWRGQEGE